MKFGLFVPQGWRFDLVGVDPDQHWGVMAGLARRADSNPNWASIWVYDHFHTFPIHSEEATHEAWSLMSAFAAVTGRVRLGQMCSCMAYRNPAYLAKTAATIDIISEGRLDMGIGAGWYEHEWRAYGYGFPRAGERLGALKDGVEIFRQMWTTGSATHEGKYLSADGALCYPQPLQGTSVPGSKANGIPIWIAGGGEKVTLKIAAQYADYTNYFGDFEEFTRKSDILRGHCEDLGRDFGEIVRSSNYNVLIGRDEKEVQEQLKWVESHYRNAGLPDEMVEATVKSYRNGPLTGTPEQITENLTKLEAAGMTYAICYFLDAAYDLGSMELFERSVMPHFKSRDEHGHLWHLMRGH